MPSYFNARSPRARKSDKAYIDVFKSLQKYFKADLNFDGDESKYRYQLIHGRDSSKNINLTVYLSEEEGQWATASGTRYTIKGEYIYRTTTGTLGDWIGGTAQDYLQRSKKKLDGMTLTQGDGKSSLAYAEELVKFLGIYDYRMNNTHSPKTHSVNSSYRVMTQGIIKQHILNIARARGKLFTKSDIVKAYKASGNKKIIAYINEINQKLANGEDLEKATDVYISEKKNLFHGQTYLRSNKSEKVTYKGKCTCIWSECNRKKITTIKSTGIDSNGNGQISIKTIPTTGQAKILRIKLIKGKLYSTEKKYKPIATNPSPLSAKDISGMELLEKIMDNQLDEIHYFYDAKEKGQAENVKKVLALTDQAIEDKDDHTSTRLKAFAKLHITELFKKSPDTFKKVYKGGRFYLDEGEAKKIVEAYKASSYPEISSLTKKLADIDIKTLKGQIEYNYLSSKANLEFIGKLNISKSDNEAIEKYLNKLKNFHTEASKKSTTENARNMELFKVITEILRENPEIIKEFGKGEKQLEDKDALDILLYKKLKDKVCDKHFSLSSKTNILRTYKDLMTKLS